jgi:4-diphosphocytidyl-2-C-methyl-D-erythritol kinase
VKVRVPAKINLHLGVGEVRPDGFHELMTVFQSLGLWDTVTITPAAELSVHVTGEGAGSVPTDKRNLAWQAASLLADRHGVDPCVRIEIDKAIPVAAGLAGGSADAAATLVGCDALWGLHSSRSQLEDAAALLGSDVAFGLVGGIAIGTGRGEVLSPVLGASATSWWVLALADAGLSTPAVYAEFDRLQHGQSVPALTAPAQLLRALQSDDVSTLADALRNDLEPAAVSLAPYLRDTLEAGLVAGAVAAVVAGSGPTCAFLVANADSARSVAARLGREGVCRTTRVAAGPVHGAQLC